MRALPGFPAVRAFFAAGRVVVHGLPAQGTALYLIGCLAALALTSETAAGALFPGQRFAAGDAPRSVAVADLDGDTVPDLVTANSLGFGNRVNVLLPEPDAALGLAACLATLALLHRRRQRRRVRPCALDS